MKFFSPLSISRLRYAVFFLLSLPLLLLLLKYLMEGFARARVPAAASTKDWETLDDLKDDLKLQRARRAMEKVRLDSSAFRTVAALTGKEDRTHPLSEVLWDAGYDMCAKKPATWAMWFT